MLTFYKSIFKYCFVLVFLVMIFFTKHSSLAITWSDSNTRPDGVSDHNLYYSPSEESAPGAVVVLPTKSVGAENNSDSIGEADVYDSGD